MSDSPEERAKATVKQAEKLIADVQRSLDDGEAFFRQQGLNRDKVRDFVGRSISPENQRKLDEQLKKDLADVDEEVHQAKLRSTPASTGGKPKRPRNMI